MGPAASSAQELARPTDAGGPIPSVRLVMVAAGHRPGPLEDRRTAAAGCTRAQATSGHAFTARWHGYCSLTFEPAQRGVFHLGDRSRDCDDQFRSLSLSSD